MYKYGIFIHIQSVDRQADRCPGQRHPPCVRLLSIMALRGFSVVIASRRVIKLGIYYYDKL